MKNIKGWLTGGTLAAVLLFGSTFAKADPGIIFGVADSGTSTDRTATKATTVTRNDAGIIFGKDGIIFGKAGIIFGITGIIFG